MYTISTLKHGMHRIHDGGIKAAHMTGHLAHEMSFWGILAVLAVLGTLIALVILYGEQMPAHDFKTSTPYFYF